MLQYRPTSKYKRGWTGWKEDSKKLQNPRTASASSWSCELGDLQSAGKEPIQNYPAKGKVQKHKKLELLKFNDVNL